MPRRRGTAGEQGSRFPLLLRLARRPGAHGGPSQGELGRLVADPARTLLRVAQESSPQPGRPYPPPPASEPFWPAQATVLAAIGLQVSLPPRLTVGPSWLI